MDHHTLSEYMLLEMVGRESPLVHNKVLTVYKGTQWTPFLRGRLLLSTPAVTQRHTMRRWTWRNLISGWLIGADNAAYRTLAYLTYANWFSCWSFKAWHHKAFLNLLSLRVCYWHAVMICIGSKILQGYWIFLVAIWLWLRLRNTLSV